MDPHHPNTTVSMAGRMEAKIAALALLSLVAVTLLAHTLLHRPRATAWFLSTVDLFRFDAHRLVELVNRRNMILLCNAILLVILKDAGLLAAPARPRSTTTAPATAAVGAACSSSEARPQSKSRQSSTAAGGAGADEGRLKREHRGPETATARLRRGKPPTRARQREYAAVQEIDPAEKQRSDYSFNHFHHGIGNEIAVVADEISSLHDERSRAEEYTVRQKTEPELVDDVDEMNKKFEEFIASMRRKMHLESLQQQVHV